MASLGTYIKESYNELLTKVTWPTWKNLTQSSVLVFVASLIISLLVWLMDKVFGINQIPDGESGWRGLLGWIYSIIT